MSLKTKLLSAFAASVIVFSSGILPAFSETGPVVLKNGIHLTNTKFLVYWKNPKAKEPQYNTWTWAPRMTFDVQGPLSPGSIIAVDFMYPNGKPWLSFDCQTPQLQDGEVGKIELPDIQEKQGITQAGKFKFAIRLKNELEGKNQVLYTGNFNVGKFHVGNNLPDFKNQYEFYVDHDWALPLGYLYLNPSYDQKAPRLNFETWFKGELDSMNLDAYLYKDGKLVANTKKGPGKFSDYGGGTKNTKFTAMTPGSQPEPRWELWNFNFTYVIGYNGNEEGSSSNFEDFHILAANPGEYEIKILRSGKLARSAKFTVDKEGKIVAPGMTEMSRDGNNLMAIPVKVIADQDKGYKPNAWKTDMYYGNPLKNF